MKAFVTGGGGFIGGAAAAALRAAGHEVKLGLRRGPEPFDLDEPHTLAPALVGVNVVVHCAYGDLAAMPAQMEALLGAMGRAGVCRLVHLSSIAVYGEAEGEIAETAALAARDPYGAAKIACEAVARRWSGEAVVLRPGAVYGAGSAFWVDKLARRIQAGVWGDFGPQGEGIAPLLHIDDLCRMIVRVAESGRGTFNAIGPETPSWNAWFAALAQALGEPLPRWSEGEVARRRWLALAAKAWRQVGGPGGEALALGPTLSELALFSRRAIYSTEAAARLGFHAEIGLADGLARCGLARL